MYSEPDVDYAQLVKLYGASGENETRYSPAKCIGCLSKAVTGDPRPEARFHVLRGALQSHDADAHAPVHHG